MTDSPYRKLGPSHWASRFNDLFRPGSRVYARIDDGEGGRIVPAEVTAPATVQSGRAVVDLGGEIGLLDVDRVYPRLKDASGDLFWTRLRDRVEVSLRTMVIADRVRGRDIPRVYDLEEVREGALEHTELGLTVDARITFGTAHHVRLKPGPCSPDA